MTNTNSSPIGHQLEFSTPFDDMFPWMDACEAENLAESYLSNSSSSSSPQITSPKPIVMLDEQYLDQLIDLELRNVQSSLGLVWSKLACTTSNSNVFQFQTNLKKHTSVTKQKTSNKTSPSSIETPVSVSNKISKKRIVKKENYQKSNYRVRFSYNKFEEIEFKKSNPKGKFIIFK